MMMDGLRRRQDEERDDDDDDDDEDGTSRGSEVTLKRRMLARAESGETSLLAC